MRMAGGDPATQRITLPGDIGAMICADRGDKTHEFLHGIIDRLCHATSSVKRSFIETLPNPPALRYVAPEELVWDVGEKFDGVITECDLPKMMAGNCFDNCFNMSLKDPTLRYYEGWACVEGSLPAHHAWLVDANGKVQDPTWLTIVTDSRNTETFEQKPDIRYRAAYRGVHIPLPTHLMWFLEHNTMNLLSYGEMAPEEVLRHGMDAFLKYEPAGGQVGTEDYQRVLDALSEAGKWELQEGTTIFVHSSSGARWDGARHCYV